MRANLATLAPEPIPLHLFSSRPELLDDPLRTTAADPMPSPTPSERWLATHWPAATPNHFRFTGWWAVIRQQLAPDQQQTTAAQALGLLTAAAPGDPENAANWAAYTELAPHALATATQADHTPAARHLVLDTARCLYAFGDKQGSRSVSVSLVDPWRSSLGPEHPDTLSAASNLSITLVSWGRGSRAAPWARTRCSAASERSVRITRPHFGAPTPSPLL